MKPPVYAMTPPRVDAPKVGKIKPVQQPKVAKMRGIDEALDYYLGPTGIPDKLRAVNSMLNPVETLGGSMRASQRLFAPETDGWGRVQALGDMLSGVGGFVAPMVAAAKVGAPAASAVADAFTGINTAPATQAAKTTATDFALRDDGSVPLFGGGKSDPTATGWTFRDMRKPILTGADEKRVQSMFDRVQWQETELPIGRMIATQPTVNPDFAETLSSQDLLPTVVQKGNELFVRDGHHRLVKAAEAGSTKAKVALLNLDPPTDAPLLDYRAPPPWSAEDDDLLAELMAPVAPMRPVTQPEVAPMRGVGGSVEETLQAKYPGVKLSISGDAERGFTLNRIEVPKSERGSGIGTKVMNDFTAMADASGAAVRLSPSGDFGGSPSRLRDFYKRFGFVDNAGKNKDFGTREAMLRAPKKTGQ